METEIRPEEEVKNDNAIPAEMKEQLADKVNTVLRHIALIENAINNAIDDTIEEINEPITVPEIISALLNASKRMNQNEIMQLVRI